jgi:hypothetical protein
MQVSLISRPETSGGAGERLPLVCSVWDCCGKKTYHTYATFLLFSSVSIHVAFLKTQISVRKIVGAIKQVLCSMSKDFKLEGENVLRLCRTDPKQW